MAEAATQAVDVEVGALALALAISTTTRAAAIFVASLATETPTLARVVSPTLCALPKVTLVQTACNASAQRHRVVGVGGVAVQGDVLGGVERLLSVKNGCSKRRMCASSY